MRALFKSLALLGLGCASPVVQAAEIQTHPIGTNYSPFVYALAHNLRDVAYGNGRFVAVGQGSYWYAGHDYDYYYQYGLVYFSSNGVTWDRFVLDSDNRGADVFGVACGNGRYVAVGTYNRENAAFASTDGKHWTVRAWTGYPFPRHVIFVDGQFVAAGEGNSVLLSPDGVTWSAKRLDQYYSMAGLAYGNGRFVAMASYGSLVSSNGISWQFYDARPASDYYAYFTAITRGQGIFLAPYGSVFMASPQGTEWVKVSEEAGAIDALGYGAGHFLAFRSDGYLQTSLNAVEWQCHGRVATQTLNAVVYADNRFVAVGNQDQICTLVLTNATEWLDLRRPLSAPVVVSGPDPVEHRAECYGTDVAISVEAVGNPLPQLHWQRNGVDLSAPNWNTLVLKNLTFADSGNYRAVVTNALGTATSGALALDVVAEPPSVIIRSYLTTNLDSVDVPAGAMFQLNADATVCPMPAFQWYFQDQPLPEASNRWLGLASITTNEAGPYTVVASNLAGVTTSLVFTVRVYEQAPTFVLHPQDRTPMAGENFYLEGSAEGAPPPAYQWWFNGAPLLGATNYYLSTYASDPKQTGNYLLVASNALGAATSGVARVEVRVLAPGSMTFLPFATTVVEGAPLEFIANSGGNPTPALALQWNGTHLGYGYSTYFSQAGYFTYGFKILEATLGDTGNYALVASNLVGIRTSAVQRVTVVPGGPLDRWARRNPLPQGNNLLSVTSSGGKLVAVGEHGAILSSDDGTNWASQALRSEAQLEGVAFGKGRYVAVGEEGVILTSTDGRQWTPALSDQRVDWHSVTYGDGLFVAVGDGATPLAVSSDGVSWSRREYGSYMGFRHVTHGNGIFVAIGNYREVWISQDGSNWWSSFLPSYPVVECVAFLNGQFVISGNNGLVLTSSDAVNWTSQDTPTDRRLLGLAYGNGKSVAVGTRGTIIHSPDAATWFLATSGTPDRLESVTFANGLFVALGENGTTLTSADGVDWVRQNRGTTRDLDGMAVAGDQVVVVGKYGTVLTSDDGMRFQERPIGVTNDLHGVAFDGNQFVAVGDVGMVLTSTNGTDWMRRETHTTSALKRVAHGGLWMAVGTEGVVLTSPDGVTWTLRDVGIFDDLNDVAYGNGTFVVVGDQYRPNATILVSRDGETWGHRNQDTGKNMRAITFADGVFLAAGNDGSLLVSTNGDTWSPVPFPLRQDDANLRSVNFAEGQWIIVGNNGVIHTSTNRLDWVRRPSRTLENLHGAEYLNGTWVTIGNRGNILQSGRYAGTVLVVRTFDPDVGFELAIHGEPGRDHLLQASEDLVHWTDLFQFSNTQPTTVYVDEETEFHPQRFYRVVSP